ncbi:MAG: tetratricopeptide repeat protein [Polyangia bacterium]
MPLWLIAAAPAVVMAVSWLRWRNAELRARMRDGQSAVSDGDLERAAEIFASLMRLPGGGTIGRERLAWTRMRQGQLQEAIALYLAARPALFEAIELARLYALRGDVDGATRWTTEARRRLARAHAVDRATAEARLVLVEVLTMARAGRLEEAWGALSQRWSAFEKSHGGWLVEACLVRGYLGWKGGAGVETWLGLGEAERAHARWMASEWPELREFIDAHDPI